MDITISNFDLQMNQAQATNRSNLKKRTAGTATGVAAIAIVACITLLIVNSGSSQRVSGTEELSITQQDPTNSFLSNQIFIDQSKFRQFMNLQKHYTKEIQNIGQHIYNLLQPDQVQLNRLTNLAVQFFFDLIDSNDNNIVDQAEWKAFFGALFPLDTAYFYPLFDTVNNKQAFKIDQFKSFIFDQEKKNNNQAPQLKTDAKAITNNFGKLILKDDNNYKKTYTFLFNIYDANSDKIITKDEYINLLVSLGAPKQKTTDDANKLFAFAKQNKFGTDTQIKFADWVNFAEALKKPLRDMLNKNTLALQKEQLSQQALISVFAENQDIYHATMNMIQDQIDLQASVSASFTADQQKILDHLLNTIATYEFDLVDTNDDQVMTRDEYVTFINAIFKNQADRQHFYGEFDEINKGQSVTYAQFLQYCKDELSAGDSEDDDSKSDDADDDSDDLKYKPHEKLSKIQKRLAKLLITNDKNYQLTYTFVFNLFDVTEDKTVTSAEIINVFTTFNVPADKIAALKQNVQKVFDGLKAQGVGDGSSVTYAQWTQFAVKIRPEIIKSIQKMPNFKLQFIGQFEAKF